jgi:hypothetical protein
VTKQDGVDASGSRQCGWKDPARDLAPKPGSNICIPAFEIGRKMGLGFWSHLKDALLPRIPECARDRIDGL